MRVREHNAPRTRAAFLAEWWYCYLRSVGRSGCSAEIARAFVRARNNLVRP